MQLAHTLALTLALTLAPSATAQPFEIDWYTIDGGGGASAGGSFNLTGTIAQHDASTPLAAAGYLLQPGFWPGAGAASCPCDLNANGILNLDDINAFAAAFLGGDPAADLDGNGVLNLDDINAFAQCFLAGCQ